MHRHFFICYRGLLLPTPLFHEDLCDLYDRMTGAVLHQQTRIRWIEARSAEDFFLILPSCPVPPTLAPLRAEKES